MNVIDQYISPHASIYNADTCEGIRSIPDNSIDVAIFSPPFESLFTYSASDRDLGNSHGREQFARHLSFIASEMFRVMKPGRLVCIHCMDLPTTLVHDGYIGFVDFPARLREVYEAASFIYHCPKVTIWKDPEVAANRTYARQLTHHEMVKDSSMSGVGAPDYILIMRKPGQNEVSITHMDPCAWSKTKAPPPSEPAPEGGSRRETCPDCRQRVDILEDGTWDEHMVPRDELARKDDAGKPRHWQRWASPVWAFPDADKATLPPGTFLAGPVDLGDEMATFAFTATGDVHELLDGRWLPVSVPIRRVKALQAALRRTSGADMRPFPQFVWATSNGLWTDGFVDYESPRVGNPDHRGIEQSDTLNFRAARENEDERHICPLQVGVVRRLLDLYSRPGETLFTPFMGIGTEVVCAVDMGRRGVGFELKASYFRQAVEHVKRVEPGAVGQQTSLLDRIVQGTCQECGEPGPVGKCECGGEVRA